MSFGIPRCYAERCLAKREAARLAEREAARLAEREAARLAEREAARLAEREAARLAEREAADGCRPAGRTATLWYMVTTLVFLVRHAKAANRDVWTGGDRGRP